MNQRFHPIQFSLFDKKVKPGQKTIGAVSVEDFDLRIQYPIALRTEAAKSQYTSFVYRIMPNIN